MTKTTKRGSSSSSATSLFSTLRVGMGVFVLFSLCTNLYVIYIFHRHHDVGGGAITGVEDDDDGAPDVQWPKQRNANPATALKGQMRGTNNKTDQNNNKKEVKWQKRGNKEQADVFAAKKMFKKNANKNKKGGENKKTGDNAKMANNKQKQVERKQEAGIVYDSKMPTGNTVWQKPDNWKTMGFYNVRKHFKCTHYAHDLTKPLPTEEDWNFFKSKYKVLVNKDKVFDDPVPSSQGYSIDNQHNPQPYYAVHGERGRGLFATRDIEKGELVHDGGIADVTFPNGMAWRRFIFNLPRNKGE